jgi:hypothetical protein
LRELDPAVDMVRPMPYIALQIMADAGNPSGMQNYWKAGFVEEYPTRRSTPSSLTRNGSHHR